MGCFTSKKKVSPTPEVEAETPLAKKPQHEASSSPITKLEQEMAQLIKTREEIRQYQGALKLKIQQAKVAIAAHSGPKQRFKAVRIFHNKKQLEDELEASRTQLLDLGQQLGDIKVARMEEIIREAEAYVQWLKAQLPIEALNKLCEQIQTISSPLQLTDETLTKKWTDENQFDELETEEAAKTARLNEPRATCEDSTEEKPAEVRTQAILIS